MGAYYGYFAGGDPRNFSPDIECSTEEERAAHKAACEAWDRGERPDIGGPHRPLLNADGREVGHITLSGYGLGINTYPDDVCWECGGKGATGDPPACADCLEDLTDPMPRPL